MIESDLGPSQIFKCFSTRRKANIYYKIYTDRSIVLLELMIKADTMERHHPLHQSSKHEIISPKKPRKRANLRLNFALSSFLLVSLLIRIFISLPSNLYLTYQPQNGC